MRVKIVTLEYDERLRGFSQEALDRACSGGTLLEFRDHFFVHAGSPHLAIVMTIDEASVRAPNRGEPDPGRELSPQLQGLYNSLRHWRNEKAKADGVPAYVLFRNTQLAEICRQVPRTMAALQVHPKVMRQRASRRWRTASEAMKAGTMEHSFSGQDTRLSHPSLPVFRSCGNDTSGASAASKRGAQRGGGTMLHRYRGIRWP